MTRTRRLLIIGAIGLVIALAAVWFVFIRDTSPPAFDVGTAADAVVTTDPTTTEPTTAPTTTTPSTTTTAAPGTFAPVEGSDAPALPYDGDPSGRWVVDPDFEGADGEVSEAGYRVEEELSTVGAKTVVGRTPLVSGAVEIDGSVVTSATFVVDMDSVRTDSDNRDRRYRGALDTSEFPIATFELAEPLDVGRVPAAGETISVEAPGTMTIHGVTRPVVLTLDAVIVGDTLVVVGSTPVTFADYGVDTPSAAIVVSLDDFGLIEFQLFFKKVT